jgi:transcriptional regulator with XRE-family HTH domain
VIDRAFAVVLRRLRERKGLSQEAFGFEVGIHRTYVSQLERGLKSPSLRVLACISDVLGVRLSKLVTLVENEFPALKKTR